MILKLYPETNISTYILFAIQIFLKSIGIIQLMIVSNIDQHVPALQTLNQDTKPEQ
jgi:hypothetical protein